MIDSDTYFMNLTDLLEDDSIIQKDKVKITNSLPFYIIGMLTSKQNLSIANVEFYDAVNTCNVKIAKASFEVPLGKA